MDQQRNEQVEQRRAAQAQRRAAQQARQRAVKEERRATQEQLRAERVQKREKREQERQALRRHAQEQQRFGLIAGLVIMVLAIAALVIYLNQPRSPGDDPAIVASPIPTSVETIGRQLGSATAPVAIIEHGDDQCPECGAFARDEAAG